MNKSELTNSLKKKALEAGFELVGVVRAQDLESEGALLKEWLGLGYQGEMKWLEREPEKRADPRLLLPGAKSVVSLALNYFSHEDYPEEQGHGKISRYAWGDDYHLVIKERLGLLTDWIQNLVPGAKAKACVDTSPIMDKAWAVRAGLGWLGKHTNVITKEFGSWVFLAEIVTDIEFEYDTEVVEDHCGSCTACLDACPTDAIVEPYLVDSNRCISYATIELRSAELPDQISSNLEGWLFGCDICQDVCPWNRFQQETREPRFSPRPRNVSPLIDDVLSLTHEEYVEQFRRTAVKRTKLTGLKRNAAALRALDSKKKEME